MVNSWAVPGICGEMTTEPKYQPSNPYPLSAQNLTVGVNGRVLVDELHLDLTAGQFVCLLGPNGVGKTLSLHTLAGLLDPVSGSVNLSGDDLKHLDRSDIAEQLGLLLQDHQDAFPTSVLETALLGRHARLGFWQWETAADIDVARQALQTMDLQGLEQRPAQSLSGGERRRLAMATLLVQDPQVFLLDEPMNHLDPLHRLALLDCLKNLTRQGRSVLASLHDPVLAARCADSVLMLFGDGRWQYGQTEELLTESSLEALYGTPFRRFESDGESVLLPVTQS